MSSASSITSMEVAVAYAEKGWRVIPNCRPGPDGSCLFGRLHKKPKLCGKTPLLGDCWQEKASSDTSIVTGWFRQWNGANIGILLENVLVVDPDTNDAQEEAWKLGLDGGLARYSRQKAYLFRRPSGCPIHNVIHRGQSGAIDILTNGQLIVYGTHGEGVHIFVEDPNGVLAPTTSDLYKAPDWAVEAVVKAEASTIVIDNIDHKGFPPVRLDDDSMEWWTGEQAVRNGDSDIDRSETLWTVGKKLFEAGANPQIIAEALRERDGTLGYDKYLDRKDDSEYWRIAQKVATATNGRKPHARINSMDGDNGDDIGGGDVVHNTDLGNAQRLVTAYGRNLRHCAAFNKWIEWDDRRWRIDDTGQVYRYAKEVIRAIFKKAGGVDDTADRKKLVQHALRSEAEAQIKAMVELAKTEPGIPIRPADLDTNLWLFNCLNGTLDLHTGKLNPHRRKDLITKLAPVDYDSEARCPTWDAFLKRIMAEDEGKIRFQQRKIGYSLTGDTREQVIFINHGVGDNGKTTEQRTLSAMMGDYASSTPTETLMVKRDGHIPNDLARLHNVRMVFASEAEQGKHLAEAQIKQMTGQDSISARFMRGEWFDFVPQFKIWLNTNHKPVIKGTDKAIWDRIRLIPFTVIIPEDEQDKDLVDKLTRELPGILAWAVRGCLEWQKDGLGLPDEVKNATAEYRQEMDLLGGFLEDRCVKAEEEEVVTKELYEVYVAWCEENGEKPISKTAMGISLEERGFTPARLGPKQDRGWRGIGLSTA